MERRKIRKAMMERRRRPYLWGCLKAALYDQQYSITWVDIPKESADGTEEDTGRSLGSPTSGNIGPHGYRDSGATTITYDTGTCTWTSGTGVTASGSG